MTNDIEPENWLHRSNCLDVEDKEIFFSTDRKKMREAKELCVACPVRRECLSNALVNEDRFGMWGGADEQEIRRALSINQYGHAAARKHPPRCPLCKCNELKSLEKKRARSHLSCTRCGLTWWARRALVKKVEQVKTK